MFLMELGTQEHLVMEQLVICCLDLFTAGIWSVTRGRGAHPPPPGDASVLDNPEARQSIRS